VPDPCHKGAPLSFTQLALLSDTGHLQAENFE
jgi:hypothetical protein